MLGDPQTALVAGALFGGSRALPLVLFRLRGISLESASEDVRGVIMLREGIERLNGLALLVFGLLCVGMVF